MEGNNVSNGTARTRTGTRTTSGSITISIHMKNSFSAARRKNCLRNCRRSSDLAEWLRRLDQPAAANLHGVAGIHVSPTLLNELRVGYRKSSFISWGSFERPDEIGKEASSMFFRRMAALHTENDPLSRTLPSLHSFQALALLIVRSTTMSIHSAGIKESTHSSSAAKCDSRTRMAGTRIIWCPMYFSEPAANPVQGLDSSIPGFVAQKPDWWPNRSARPFRIC
jgi:hypothetical protein